MQPASFLAGDRMSKTKYAYAVAAVKAMEGSLLSRGEIDRLINSASASEVNAILSASGSDTGSLEDTWQMIRNYAPDDKGLEILLYKNDFHNVKAVLKAALSGKNAEDYIIRPTNLDIRLLINSVNTKEYSALPEYIRGAAEEAYELLTRTLDGQLSDSLIDCAALNAMKKSAEECGSEFMKRYAGYMAVTSDIKTAYRCAKMNKTRKFMESAVCGSDELDKDMLISAALGGTESLFSFLESSAYSEPAALLKESPAQFEKWCDDTLMELAETSRFKTFGSDPLAAFYIAKEAEIKNLRILSVCKESGSDKKTITERMRRLYV